MNWGDFSRSLSLGGAAFCLALEIEGAQMGPDKGGRGDTNGREKDKETLGFPFRLPELVHWCREGGKVLRAFCPPPAPPGISYPSDFAHVTSFISNALAFFSPTLCSWNLADSASLIP